jgi:hypothetical protein
VVVVLVVVVGPHAESTGFVQEQNVSPLILHCSRTNLLQALKSAPDKLPHAAVISSAHCLEPQSGGAALAPELGEDRDDLPVEEVEDVDHDQHPEDIAGVALGSRRGVGSDHGRWRIEDCSRARRREQTHDRRCCGLGDDAES